MKRFLPIILLVVFSSTALVPARAARDAVLQSPDPTINRVYEYIPAPGQFVGENYPRYNAGDDYQTILQRVDSTLSGHDGTDRSRLICLGAWGGQITFGFDHDVINVVGQYDLRIFGNAFCSGQPRDGYQYGSFEPGIIWVSADDNENGLPDDTWYEIAGSESANTTRGYQVTYHYSTGDIRWEDNLGGSGVVKRNAWHTQASYYPAWRTDTTMTITGSLLPTNLNANLQSYCYAYGYVDNQPNDSAASAINLDWAIDATGAPANLHTIRFVRVQTGVLADWGVSGEISTEIAGAIDLHPEATDTNALEDLLLHAEKPTKQFINGCIYIRRGSQLYSITGQRIE